MTGIVYFQDPDRVNGTPVSAENRFPVDSSGAAREVSVTFTPAAAAYSANDIMDVAKAFANIGPSSGGQVYLVGTVLEIAAAALISGETSYNLQVYNVTPPSARADNAPWDLPSGDRTAHIATIPLGTAVDIGATCKIEVDNINKLLTVPDGGTLYAELVTVGGFTATAVARKVTLKTVAV